MLTGWLCEILLIIMKSVTHYNTVSTCNILPVGSQVELSIYNQLVMKSLLGINMRTNITCFFPTVSLTFCTSLTPSPPKSLFLYSAPLPEQPPHNSFLVHQRHNLADWAAERLQLVVRVGNLRQKPLPPSLSQSLSLGRILVPCPSLHISQTHVHARTHAHTHTHTHTHTYTHVVVNRWTTSRKQAYLTFSPSQIPKENSSEYHLRTSSQSIVLKDFSFPLTVVFYHSCR